MSIYDSLFTISSKPKLRYSVVREGEEESGVGWLVQFELQPSEFDDTFDSDYREEIIISAVDFDTAHKYALQYIRKMQLDPETGHSWKDARIVTIDKQ